MNIPDRVHVQWVEEEAVVLNEETSEVHYLNPQSALIYALVLEFGMPQAIDHLCERLNGPPDEIRLETAKVVASFKEKGLLNEGPAESG